MSEIVTLAEAVQRCAVFAREAGERQAQAEARLAAEIEAQGHPEACGGNLCPGHVEVGGHSLPCPLAAGGCPFATGRERAWRERVRDRLRVGRRHLGVKLELVPEVVRPALAAYLADLPRQVAGGRGLILLGGTGTGKTSLLTLLAFEAARAGLWVENWYAPALASALMRREGVAWEDCAACDLLLIDDLGIEYRSEYLADRMDALVDARYREERATCVSSNATAEALLAAPAHQRIASRWAEVCQWLDLGGEDRRREQ